MRLFLRGLLCAGIFLFSGCSVHRFVPEPQAEQVLAPIYTEKLPGQVEFLEFSENGKTFIAAGGHDFLFLYDANKFEKNFAINYHANHEDMFSRPLSISGAGYVDGNAWYFVTKARIDSMVNILQIEPFRFVYQQLLYGSPAGPIWVNRNHIAYGEKFWNWHDGRAYEVESAHPAIFGHRLSSDSLVVTHNFGLNAFLFYDPLKQDGTVWHIDSHSDVWFSPDTHYGLATTERGKCGLWNLRSMQSIGRCGRSALWGGRPWHLGVFARDNSAFAVAADKEVAAYTIKPFAQQLSVSMPHRVTALAVDTGRLAAMDESGHVRVWNMDTGALRAEYPSKREPGYRSGLLAFQPGGSKLVSTTAQLMVFDLGF